MKHWQRAIELLVERHRKAGGSINSLDRQRIAGNEQFYRWPKMPLGPSLDIFCRVLEGMGFTWHDWAEAYEQAKRQHQHSHAAEHAPPYGARRPKKPAPLLPKVAGRQR